MDGRTFRVLDDAIGYLASSITLHESLEAHEGPREVVLGKMLRKRRAIAPYQVHEPWCRMVAKPGPGNPLMHSAAFWLRKAKTLHILDSG
jgi:hypothetical protein